MLPLVKERFGFFAVHNSYAPGVIAPFSTADSEPQNTAMLAAPDDFAEHLAISGEAPERVAPVTGRDAKIAITEHAPLFLGLFDGSIVKQLERNRTIASAVFSAASFNVFISNPRVGIADHLKLSSVFYEWVVKVDFSDGHGRPFRTAYGHVFKLYSEAAGATVVKSATDCDVRFDSRTAS